MPKYEVVLSDGRKFHVEADSRPSEADILAQLGHGTSTQSDTDVVAKAAGKATGIQSDSWLRRALDTLPTVGGIVGGLAGGKATPLATGLSAAGGAVGEGLRQGGYALSGRPTATNIPQQMAQAALEQAGSTLLGAGISKGAGAVAPWLYRTALKPPISERLAPRAATTVRTGLEEGINPISARSLAKIEPRISDLNARVEGMVHSTGGTPIASSTDITSRLGRVARNYSGAGADPADRAAVQGVQDQFLTDTGGQPLSGPELLRARRSTGRSAGGKNFGITRGAETEARKELYGSLGTEIGNQYPRTQPLLDRESRLIDLKDAGQAAYERHANQPAISLRDLIPYAGTGAVASVLGGGPTSGLTAIALLKALRSPRLGARAAISLHQLSKHPQGAAMVPRSLFALGHQLQEDDEQ